MSGKTSIRIGIAASFLVLAAMPAAAQQQAQENPSLDTIIVTADRREASIQDVPISITALTGQSLAEAGIQSTQELSNLTPGLLVQRSVVGKISIRGVGNENYTIAGDPGVAVHTDGVYIARASAGLFDLFDVNRVEVLRGPQGTLYGRNATGGVINILPNQPGDEVNGYVSAEYGNYDKVRLEGALGGPLGDTGLSARIAMLGAWRDGYTKNVYPGAEERGLGDLDNQDLWALRGQLAYDRGGPVRVRLATEYLHDNSNLPAYKYLNQPSSLPNENYYLGDDRTVSQGFETQVPGASRGVGSDEDIFKMNQLGLSMHVDVDVGDLTLKSITGYRDTAFNWVNDGDGAAIFYVNYIQQDKNKQYSQELQLSSVGGERLDWIIGAFWFRETGQTWMALPFTFGFNLPFYIEIDGTAKTNALAGFGEVNFKATDRLKLTLGARYNHEKRSTNYIYDVNFGSLARTTVDDEATFNAFTPRLVLSYEANNDVNLYASVTRGFKSGGFNMLAVQPGFKPEKVWSYEAGIKSDLGGGIARLNANVFYTDYKDMQVGQIVNLSSVLTNAARSRLYGVEADFLMQPVQVLELGATAAYLNAKYDDFCTGDPTQPTASVSSGCSAANPIQLKGNTLPRAPEWTLTGSAVYTMPLGEAGTIALRSDVRYQSKIYFTQFNRELVSQKGYVVANSRLTWTSADDKFNVGLWVNNLFDKLYYTEVLESGAFNPQLVAQANVAPPRTYGLSAGYRF